MAGRPLKFKVPEDLQTAVDAYFSNEEKVTLAGLALSLDIDRQTLYNYADRNEFFDIIKKARERVEAKYESRLIYDGSPTGVIFALKNMGWKDQSAVDHTTAGEQVQFYLPHNGRDKGDQATEGLSGESTEQ